jgi:hypothetical protein
VRKRALHIIFPVVLIANLLFSQVAINLLHDNHTFGKPTIELQKNQASIQKYTERCKVCSLDIIFNLFYNPSASFDILLAKDTLVIFSDADVIHLPVSFTQDRAPPVFIY